MCMYLAYPRPISVILKERFLLLERRFTFLQTHEETSLLDHWVNLLSDLLSEICYLHEFSWGEFPSLDLFCRTLSTYATQIQSTYKI